MIHCNYNGAMDQHLRFTRKKTGSDVQIKTADSIRTLHDLIRVKSLGVTRIGATTMEAIPELAQKGGIGQQEVTLDVSWRGDGQHRL